VLITTADIIRRGTAFAGTMNSQNGSPRATIIQTIKPAAGGKRADP
jgi:hypothetical protein